MTPEQRAAALELARRVEARKAAASKKYCPHEPTAKQRSFVEYDGLEALFGGAAGGGKSDALLMAALRFVHVPGYSAILFRKSYTDLALPGAIMDRSHAWLAKSDAHWDGINKRWRFPSTAALSFGYLDGPRDRFRYQSAEFQFEGFDEATQIEGADYTYLFSRLRRVESVSVPLRMRGATNPGGVSHAFFKARYGIPDQLDASKPLAGPDGRMFFPSLLEDNPHIDRAGYEQSLAQLDFVTREQLRRGVWRQDASGLVYAFDEDRDCVDELPMLPSGMRWQFVLGIDYGNVNATALVVLAYCLELSDIVYVVESQKWSGLIPSEAARITGEWSKRYGGFVSMVGDVGGLGKGYVEEARQRFALPIEAAEKGNKLGYIKLLNGAYQSNKLKVVRGGNPELIAELKAHPWKNGKQYLEEEPGSANHACDAHLYGWREAIAYAYRAGPPPAPRYGTPEFYEHQERAMRDAAQNDADRDPFAMDPWARD